MYFSLNLSHCVKLYGDFCQILALLSCPVTKYGESLDRRCKFRNFLFCPSFTFNIWKSHKISGGKPSISEVISQKSQGGGVENTPSTFRVNAE